MVLSLAQPAGLHRRLLTSVCFSIGGIHRWFSTGRGLPDASCERKKAKDPYGHFGGFLGWEIEEWCVHISVQLIGRPFYISLLSLSSFSFLLSFFFLFFSFFFSLLLSSHPFFISAEIRARPGPRECNLCLGGPVMSSFPVARVAYPMRRDNNRGFTPSESSLGALELPPSWALR